MKNWTKRIGLAVAALGLMVGAVGQAEASITLQYPEVNGPTMTSGFPGPQTEIATRVFTIPVGQVITSATLSGVFGQTSQFVGSTAEFNLLINNQQVGSTHDVTPDPFNNVVPFSFSISPTLLSGGSADLSYIQTSVFNVRLSQTTLTINTAVSAVPEPSMMISAGTGVLMLLSYAWRRRKRATA
jgi:hypothetical protein